jgi:hypothetical protein
MAFTPATWRRRLLAAYAYTILKSKIRHLRNARNAKQLENSSIDKVAWCTPRREFWSQRSPFSNIIHPHEVCGRDFATMNGFAAANKYGGVQCVQT